MYVALSRCTNLQGLILLSRIRKESLPCDEKIVRFSQSNTTTSHLQKELTEASKNYQQDVLLSLFDFTAAIRNCKELIEYLLEQRTSFNTEVFGWIEQLSGTISALQETAGKFHSQVQSLFQQTMPPDKNTTLQDRLKAAAAYFTKQIEQVLQNLQRSPAVTDSRQHAKEYNENLREIFAQLSMKKYLM